MKPRRRTKVSKMLKRPKAITKKQAELLCFKADNEGLSYAIMEGYLDAPDTVLEGPVEAAKEALRDIEAILEELKDKFEIEDC